MKPIAVVLLLLSVSGGDEPKLPAGMTCADVRAKVAEIGRARALALAWEYGATWAQIQEARKCLR